LCQHYCKLKNEQIGICGVNKNIGSKIENLVYGYPAALNIDPIEKKPLYHFLPTSKSLSLGTVGCNFHCGFCQNHGISQEKVINKKNYYSPEQIVQLALKNNCQSISFTYNEPTIFYPYAKDIAIEAKKKGLKNIYVSNGYESTEVINDMKGIIDAVNIDLKSFNKVYYKQYLGGNLDKILENLKLFKKNNIWIEITTLIVPTQNDSSEELKKIANFIFNELGSETPWHISAFRPKYKELTLPKTSINTLLNAYSIGKEIGLNYVYIGNMGYKNITKCSACSEILINREYFNVIKNNLVSSSCPKCNKKLDGIF
jgi:AmmeMemoRadiSam system radical SAM enzyme